MKIVNRSVMIVRPKAPYLGWANSSDGPKLMIEDLDELTTAYLVPETECPEDQDRVLKSFFKRICEHEFAAWSLDEKTWPRVEDPATFLNWFDVQFHDMVLDIMGSPIELDEF